jgi:16S rRNA (guanine527-N7)-methyltransferase
MLTADEIAGLLAPYIGSTGDGVAGSSTEELPVDWPGVIRQLAVYLELILKWNARMNLTAIREPREIVRRHFGESLMVGTHLGRSWTLLDFGSGAGFPGIPVQLMRPDLLVTLAESHGKKAAFLREVTRVLGLPSEVWSGRVEAMPAGRQFDAVTMRAVDNMGAAVREGVRRARQQMLILGTVRLVDYPELVAGFGTLEKVGLPDSKAGVLLIAGDKVVPRGTGAILARGVDV